MVQVLRGGQGAHGSVAVSAVLVGGALDLGQVGHLVQRGGGLVLVVAGARQRRQVAEVQRAVDHVALRGQRVRQHARVARAVHVAAVVARDARAGAAALGGHAPEDGGDGRARAGRGALVVLLELGGRARRRRRLGRQRERAAVGQRRAGGGEAAAGAVALHDGALGQEALARLGRLRAVDGGGDLVGDVGGGAGDVERVGLGVGEGALGQDVEGAAGGEVVHLGDVERHLDGLAGGDGLEVLLAEVRRGDAEADAVEVDAGLWCVV